MSLLGDESPYDLIDAFIRGEMERLVAHNNLIPVFTLFPYPIAYRGRRSYIPQSEALIAQLDCHFLLQYCLAKFFFMPKSKSID